MTVILPLPLLFAARWAHCCNLGSVGASEEKSCLQQWHLTVTEPILPEETGRLTFNCPPPFILGHSFTIRANTRT
jgi:hypothetical protein